MTQNNGMCEGQLLFALLIIQNTVQPQTWSFSCGSGILTETEGRLAIRQTCFQLKKNKKHQEAYRKAFVNNKITINNASGKFSTYSHSLIALNSCKAEALTFQMQIVWKVEHRRTWYVWPPLCYCVVVQFQQECVLLKSLSMTSQSLDRHFFFNCSNYGSDGRRSTSLLSQMIHQKGTKTVQRILVYWII